MFTGNGLIFAYLYKQTQASRRVMHENSSGLSVTIKIFRRDPGVRIRNTYAEWKGFNE